ncbi:MAG TPA: hypothetical protein P5218_06580 [Planctomycetota bacterium]|nr:hypothetical protein [Planctomycetota bacterium]HPF12617.1 hypothetical protein [Planctomycetota bacterium]HRV81079.1 hypothetical protein [Planctomycetota bacterium]
MKSLLSTLCVGTCLIGMASASEIFVSGDITTSTTWTANNTYNLQGQVYVLPGASLTIEAGTVVASDVTANGGGSLAVCKGAQIFILGQANNPVIMTSKADVATWTPDGSHPTGGDPRTGTWREAANEWGNLTIMGDAYISSYNIPDPIDPSGNTPLNSPVPSASNYDNMEGLTPLNAMDTRTRYGGGNDDDDSGTVQYLSLRYGGRVVGLTNELNGLSLGGIGRGTDIHHVEIMNNVDDGVEIWGGTVTLKNMSIWNIGDDNFDVDQGWRGKAQFILLVQGYSLNASQGSGVGDNMFETDGAEDSDWQPVTTATIYNATVIGQPAPGAGDGLTAWRDGARVQYRNCIFMDSGETVVRPDGDDGDGASGYGHNGTLTFADVWNTNYNVYSTVNAPANPAAFYQSQTSGKLAEMTDSVFFRNLDANAYTEANARGVFNASNNNVLIPGFADVDSPVTTVTRGPAVVRGGKTELPVIFLDPRPANAALTSVAAAPADGFFTPSNFRGAFAPGQNWLTGWTAAEAFGFTGDNNVGSIFCGAATNNSSGQPVVLSGYVGTGVGSDLHLEAVGGPTNEFGYFLVGNMANDASPIMVSNGLLCLAGLPGQVFGRYNVAGVNNSLGLFNSSGVFRNLGGTSVTGTGYDVPTTVPISSLGNPTIMAGDTWHFQLWHRDTPAGAGTSNLSQGLSVNF